LVLINLTIPITILIKVIKVVAGHRPVLGSYLKKLSNQIRELTGKRKEKIQHFKNLSPTNLTCEYVSGLSSCERFLLLKALQQTAEEAQQEQQNEEFANFLRAAGGIVLLGILLGGGGGF